MCCARHGTWSMQSNTLFDAPILRRSSPAAWPTPLACVPPGVAPPPAVLFSHIREECERIGVNERVLMSDEAGRQFYVPPLDSATKK